MTKTICLVVFIVGAVFGTSCELDDTVAGPDGVTYGNLADKNHVITNLELAYGDRDISQIARIRQLGPMTPESFLFLTFLQESKQNFQG